MSIEIEISPEKHIEDLAAALRKEQPDFAKVASTIGDLKSLISLLAKALKVFARRQTEDDVMPFIKLLDVAMAPHPLAGDYITDAAIALQEVVHGQAGVAALDRLGEAFMVLDRWVATGDRQVVLGA